MLFNSVPFIFFFLPVVLAVFYYLAGGGKPRMAFGWICLSSLFFYGWWNPFYLILLTGSILFNFGFSRLITDLKDSAPTRARFALIAGILCNITLLGYFKYTDFLIQTVNKTFATSFPLADIILPLAISFVTFQKIAYLVDCYRGLAKEHDFLNYLLFVSFFPQLIAGPIVHYREIMPQFKALEIKKTWIAMGMALFSIGLFKKAVLADLASVSSNTVFAVANEGDILSSIDAWGGAIAYSYQIYFDFSGYSDMAIGLALLFGIRLPVNFLSPYKATGFIDFWRRWHITLSRFLRDYIYIPLGGNRHGAARQSLSIAVTMLIGGLWHGASWTFVVWGGLHGLMIAANHALRKSMPSLKIPAWPCITLTFLLTTILWVFFRCESFDGALNMLQSMFFISPDKSFELLNDPKTLLLLFFLTAIIFLFPSSMKIMGLDRLDPETQSIDKTHSRITFKPDILWVMITTGAFLTGVMLMQTNIGKEFIYFDF